VLTPIAAGVGVGIAQVWGVVVEEARLHSDHISYRAAHLPMYQYKWIALALAGGIFLILASVEVHRRR